MAVYLDIAFFLNFFTDALALHVTARLSGLTVERRRLLAAAVLGGTYGAICTLPPMRMAAAFLPELAAAAVLVRLAFGKRKIFLRLFLLFFLLSCTMGGVLLAAGQMLRSGQGVEFLRSLDWRVFLIAGGSCFAVLSVVFRGEVRHAAAGNLFRGTISWRGCRAVVTVLLDTGHTLTDALTGAPVLTVYWEALVNLFTAEEREALSDLAYTGAAKCLERLGSGGRFRLLPYRAVGVHDGLLLCFRADRVELGGRDLGKMIVALSPTAVSGGAEALWGGDGESEGNHAA